VHDVIINVHKSELPIVAHNSHGQVIIKESTVDSFKIAYCLFAGCCYELIYISE